ncbi:alpha/beta hydrolase [Lutimonas sp.]|uniref:alpha/beta hydrolase n=1 Tax=Lutimonas sp. TaxID=1872403 RepID=UPI003D9B4195
MKELLLIFLLISCYTLPAQRIINLPHEEAKNSTWENPEKQYMSDIWQTEVVTNVSTPTLAYFQADPEVNTGVSVIVAPGGGLYALSIESEGNQVAAWLTQKGINVFVLKYRLVPTGEDGVADISTLAEKNPAKIGEEVAKVLPYSIADGLEAINYVRTNASELGVDTEKIGFMGFSAGGAVTMGVAYNYSKHNRPDFLVPVYAWTDAMPVQTPKKDAPPMIVICASDDPLGLAQGSVDIYNSWLRSELNAALHMYSKGGHGFGMREQGLPSDSWIERFYEWSITEGITVHAE